MGDPKFKEVEDKVVIIEGDAALQIYELRRLNEKLIEENKTLYGKINKHKKSISSLEQKLVKKDKNRKNSYVDKEKNFQFGALKNQDRDNVFNEKTLSDYREFYIDVYSAFAEDYKDHYLNKKKLTLKEFEYFNDKVVSLINIEKNQKFWRESAKSNSIRWNIALIALIFSVIFNFVTVIFSGMNLQSSKLELQKERVQKDNPV